MKTTHVLWQAITQVHVGTGQDGSGIIDLPVARESSTGYPTLPASGLKGVLRNEGKAGEHTDVLFGTPAQAGDLVFHDAKVLALPVPSLWGTFALVTCPMVLNRLKRDLALLGFDVDGFVAPTLSGDSGLVPDSNLISRGDRVLMDDFILPVVAQDLSGLISYLAEADEDIADTLRERLCVVPDDVFSFLARYRLPVTPHVRIDEVTGVVAPRALWYEESIAEETLLTSFLTGTACDPALALESQSLLQVGGHRTVGRGLVKLTVRGARES